jgi:tyrosyl-tRNA synthetase
LRILQKALAKEVTMIVHSEEDYHTAVEASEILFGKGTFESLTRLKESDFLNVFDGVPRYEVSRDLMSRGPALIELLTTITNIFPSKGEFSRLIRGGGLNINKIKASCSDEPITPDKLINHKYLIVQKGKKNYSLIVVK